MSSAAPAMKYFWHIWCKALGEKAHPSDIEADKVALVRTLLIVQAIVTNVVICLNFVFTHLI
jgi:hypothetical protein